MDKSYIDNDGVKWYLVRYGSQIEFTSDDAVLDFIGAMHGGNDAMLSAMVNNNIFTEIAAGDVDAATAVINEYFAAQKYFWMTGEAELFAAADYGGEELLDVLVDLAEWLLAAANSASLSKKLELVKSDPAKAETIAKAFQYLQDITQDPGKKADWVSKRAALRATRLSKTPHLAPKIEGLQNIEHRPATWIITTLNHTGGDTLTFVGDLPYVVPPTYTIDQQPDRTSAGLTPQVLSWYPSDTSQFLFGGDGYCVMWQTPTGHSFGVNIWIPQHVFGIGSPSYYQVWYDGWGPFHGNWVTPPGGPKSPYKFPSGWGYTVKVEPTVWRDSLFVTVVVEKETASIGDASAQ